MIRGAIGLLGLLGTTGCAEELTPQSLVSDLRVLAIRSEPASAAPGETVRLDALVVDPFGHDRPIARAWASCPSPPGDNPARCFERAAPTLLGEEETVELELPAGAAEGSIVGVLLYVCAGGSITIGDSGPLCEGTETSAVLAVKRVSVAREATNRNPVIDGLSIDGDVLGPEDAPEIAPCAAGCDAHTLALQIPEESAEPVDEDDGPGTEELVTTWHATSGGMERPFGFGPAPTVEWTPPDGSGLVLFWIVLRDDRGGVTWIERQALVR